MKTSKGNRLHIAAALIASLKLVKELLIPLLVIVVSQGFSRSGEDRSFFWRLILGAAMVLGAFVWGFLRWLWFHYRVEEDLLKVDEGVIFKKKLNIPIARIQTVDFSEGLLHRMLGLTRVQVQTAGGTKPEAVFAAVTRAEADRLERLLRPGRTYDSRDGVAAAETTGVLTDCTGVLAGQERQQAPEVEHKSEGLHMKGDSTSAEGDATFKLAPGKLFLAGLTASNLGVGVSLLFAVLSQADELFPSLRIFRTLATFSGIKAILMLASIVILLAWLLAVVSSVLRYADFTVVRRGDELLISRGLLERRKVTLPVRRIQAVRIVQEIIWKPFGLVAVHVVSAGYGTQKGESTLLFPLMGTAGVEGFLAQLCPDFAVNPATLKTRRLPARAKWGYLLPVPLFLAAATGTVSFFTPWGWWGVPLTAAVIVLEWWAYRRASCVHDERLLVMRYRWATETIVVIPRKRFQYVTVKQSPLQRRSGLSTVRISVAAASAGAHFSMKGLPLTEGEKLLQGKEIL
ncbi:MAG: rane-flanked domain protein [Paenibacillaceae bacterium]|jgi:putative membrane protein|nr:rane-flanked domain protein [Paenibacillaceae bacterium]